MNAIQVKKLGMFKQLRAFLLLSLSITGKWKSFAKWFAKFSDTIDLIEDTAEEQEESKGKSAKAKLEGRTKLKEKIIGIARKCISYAKVEAEEDFELIEFFHHIRNAIWSVSDELLLTYGRSLLAKITELKLPLADYDVTDDHRLELTKLIADFNKIYNKPETNSQDTSQFTDQLEALFAENEHNLEKLDSIVDAGFETDPEFHAMYFSKRHFEKPHYHKVALMAKIQDEQGNPLYKAKLILTPDDENGSPRVERKTSKKGNLIEKTMQVAKYNYKAIYGGLLDATGSLFIHEDQTTKLIIVMKKG